MNMYGDCENVHNNKLKSDTLIQDRDCIIIIIIIFNLFNYNKTFNIYSLFSSIIIQLISYLISFVFCVSFHSALIQLCCQWKTYIHFIEKICSAVDKRVLLQNFFFFLWWWWWHKKVKKNINKLYYTFCPNLNKKKFYFGSITNIEQQQIINADAWNGYIEFLSFSCFFFFFYVLQHRNAYWTIKMK